MSTKSHPGDGTHGQGVKGGGLYGAHFQTAFADTPRERFIRALLSLARALRARG